MYRGKRHLRPNAVPNIAQSSTQEPSLLAESSGEPEGLQQLRFVILISYRAKPISYFLVEAAVVSSLSMPLPQQKVKIKRRKQYLYWKADSLDL